ncbi:16S rRNA (guanine(966)-N(2))-methyltransferase RsmD [Glaciecola siphonariae]|uniref:Ribosomal RNA small subunit methyltransferase D n=1 Tax=Glaciecola siphonariae TaxID=521012 RepID=A0ABV9LZU2_9ALTE
MTPTPKANSPKSSWKRKASVGKNGKGAKAPVHANRSKPGSIRIISGQHRGRKLPVLLAEGLRPTTDRVKETLFNWLMQDIAGAKVLDMFAGAGSLGFEALSRLASTVVMIENSPASATQLQQNILTLKAQEQAKLIQSDAFSALKTLNETFDIVFIDPPFHRGMARKAIDMLISNELLAQDALVYIESEVDVEALNDLTCLGLTKLKEQSTQQVNYRLYRFDAEAGLPVP